MPFAKKNLLNIKKHQGVSVCRKSPTLGCYLLFYFRFLCGVFGALPPSPTSFLDPKKEAKKEYAAVPLAVFALNLKFLF